MGSLDPNPAKERRAGFITLSCVVLTMLVIVLSTQVDWRSYKRYRLVFSMLQDASGIQPGTPVNVGGILYGKVLQVASGSIATDSTNPLANASVQTSLGTIVEFELDSSIPLWASAQISRNATVLGGNVSIQIYDTGFENQTDPLFKSTHAPVVANSTIRASNPPSGMTTIFGGPVAITLDKIYSELSIFHEWFTTQARKEISAQIQNITASVDLLRAKVRSDSKEWSARIASLKSNTNEMNQLLGISNTGQQDPQSVSNIFNKAAPQIRADADSIKADYNAVAMEIKEKISPQMTKSYDDFQKQITRLQTDMETALAASKDGYGLYAASIAQLSLSGGQITRAFQDLLGGLMRAILEKPDDAGFDKQDQLMIARGLALQAQDVQLSVEDLEKLATQMNTKSPQMADEIRQRTAATLTQLKKSLDAFNASLQVQYQK